MGESSAAADAYENGRYKYIHDIHKGPPEAIDVHHIVLQRSSQKKLLIFCFLALLLFASPPFFFFVQQVFISFGPTSVFNSFFLFAFQIFFFWVLIIWQEKFLKNFRSYCLLECQLCFEFCSLGIRNIRSVI